MKIYKYWQAASGNVLIDNKLTPILCYGGSNLSNEAAQASARAKIEIISQKIAGNRHAFDSYEVEIREEIVQSLSEQAIITRNRYGAQVLNIENLMIMDIDEPRRSFLDRLKKQDTAGDKQKIIEMVRKLAQSPAYQRYSYRIYETNKGIRVIVLGSTFNTAAPETIAMMKDFNCDKLYTTLCQKQGCFRARLTPKPNRLSMRGPGLKFPRQAQEEETFRRWLAQYEVSSSTYSVCRFVEQIGAAALSDVIRLHDEISGANRGRALA